MTRKNNLLTQPQAARLYRWLEDSRQYASENTAQKLAVLATSELKFTVTETNVGTARRALGITRPKPVVVEAGACRCKELAAAILEYVEEFPGRSVARDLKFTDAIRKIIGVSPATVVAPELPLGGPCAVDLRDDENPKATCTYCGDVIDGTWDILDERQTMHVACAKMDRAEHERDAQRDQRAMDAAEGLL